jgi:replicative DNA helicase
MQIDESRLANVDAEQALLGAILLDNARFDDVADLIGAQSFAYAGHGQIFAAIAEEIEAGHAVDAVTLAHRFDGHPTLAAVGGKAYLAHLVGAVPSLINTRDYAAAIRDTALRRAQIRVYQAQAEKALDLDGETDGQALIEQAEAALQAIAEDTAPSGPVAIGAGMATFNQKLEERRAAGGGLPGLSTGLEQLDRMLNGLIAPHIIVLAARPAMGKTALATNILRAVAAAGNPALLFSLEMPRDQIEIRMIAERAHIAADRIQRADDLTDSEMIQIKRATKEIAALPLYIDDSPRLSVPAMQARARRLKRRHGLKLVAIDHLLHIAGHQRRDNRTLELGDITKSLRALAKNLQVPVLLLCQLNRESQKRDDKRPQLSDLRQSGEIEEDADSVIFLHREFYYLKAAQPKREAYTSKADYELATVEWLERCEPVQRQADLIMAKNRNGPTGACTVFFDEALLHFGNLQSGS